MTHLSCGLCKSMHLVEGPLGIDSIAQLLSLKWFWLMVENILGIQILKGNPKYDWRDKFYKAVAL